MRQFFDIVSGGPDESTRFRALRIATAIFVL